MFSLYFGGGVLLAFHNEIAYSAVKRSSPHSFLKWGVIIILVDEKKKTTKVTLRDLGHLERKNIKREKGSFPHLAGGRKVSSCSKTRQIDRFKKKKR